LWHDNDSSHKVAIVGEYLKQEKVAEFPYPSNSPDFVRCDFFLFPRLKKHLAGRKYQMRKNTVRLFSSVCIV
jgi:hypothetical protein